MTTPSQSSVRWAVPTPSVEQIADLIDACIRSGAVRRSEALDAAAAIRSLYVALVAERDELAHKASALETMYVDCFGLLAHLDSDADDASADEECDCGLPALEANASRLRNILKPAAVALGRLRPQDVGLEVAP